VAEWLTSKPGTFTAVRTDGFPFFHPYEDHIMAKKKPTPRKPKEPGKRTPRPADAAAAAAPASYEPLKETPLGAAFAVGGPLPYGAGLAFGAAPALAAAGPAGLANLMLHLGYSTVEETLGVLRIVKREFSQQFGVSTPVIEEFISALAAKATPLPKQLMAAVTAERFTFGLDLANAHRPTRAPESLITLNPIQGTATPDTVSSGGGIGIGAAPAQAGAPLGASLPSSVNLISQLPNPVRNQGGRQTCVAHSTLVAYEHYLKIAASKSLDLSEQFFYFAAVQRDGLSHNPDSGTTLTAGADGLEQAGVCEESVWPYNPTEIPGNAGQGPPPGPAASAAAQLKPSKVIRISATAVDDYKRVVASGRCTSFGVPIYGSFWNNPAAVATGRIKYFPGEQPIGGHAMCIVGYEDDASDPALGGGRFIIRNSHGTAFGASSPFGPGHGTLAYSYIAKMAMDIGISFL
jgi:Papain family cysteine protease